MNWPPFMLTEPSHWFLSRGRQIRFTPSNYVSFRSTIIISPTCAYVFGVAYSIQVTRITYVCNSRPPAPTTWPVNATFLDLQISRIIKFFLQIFSSSQHFFSLRSKQIILLSRSLSNTVSALYRLKMLSGLRPEIARSNSTRGVDQYVSWFWKPYGDLIPTQRGSQLARSECRKLIWQRTKCQE
jgi:hypothetical protein